jgi:uncharacterized NAD(P)/FAD-binding protein YdhS
MTIPSHGSKPISVAVVGAGPRGVIITERLCANVGLISPGRPLEIHLVDPFPAGGGRVWRQDQDRDLLMNTVAGDISVFTDPTVTCAGPICPGPTQYEWARRVAAGTVTGLDAWIVEEARRILPWSYARRAFQGAYLEWALQYVIDTAPPQVDVRIHRTRAQALDDLPSGRQALRLAERLDPLEVDAVVLAQGHFDIAPAAGERELLRFATRHNLVYVPPASPAEILLDVIGPGEPVMLRGLGLNFFDYTTLLTVGRGGQFERAGPDGQLRYRASGREPLLYAASGRGLPYMARAEMRKEIVPRYQPTFLTAEVIIRLRKHAGTGRLDFMNDLWPYIAKETGWVYYQHLLSWGPHADPKALARFRDSYPPLAAGSEEEAGLIRELVPDPSARWDWARLDRPAAGLVFTDRVAYTAWIRGRVADDYAHATLGPDHSALKATAAMLRDLRDEVRQVVSHRGVSGSSYHRHVERWFSGLNNFAASGPPASRVEELGALIDADVVRFVGPGMHVEADESAGVFHAHSPAVAEAPVRAAALIEAHLPVTDLRRVTDPLLRHLLDTGQCRAHVIPNAHGVGYETGGLDITEGSQQLIDAVGRAHPARFSYGPPVESVQWVTAIGARPHVNSRTLLQADAIAGSALASASDRSLVPV